MNTFHNAPPVRDHSCSTTGQGSLLSLHTSTTCTALTGSVLWKNSSPGGGRGRRLGRQIRGIHQWERGPTSGSSREDLSSIRSSNLNLYNPVLRHFFSERLVVTGAMVSMQLRIIEYWLW